MPVRRRESLPAPYTGEPLEIGFNARVPAGGARVGVHGHGAAQADQSAAAGADHGRRRRVLVPDHADPARRLIVGSVTLRDFRSYPALDCALEPGLVLVTGANGAGKTNLLESLHVGTQGFSPRTRHDAELVRLGADGGARDARGRPRPASRPRPTVTVAGRSEDGACSNGAPLRAAEQLRARGRDARVHARPAGGRQGRAGGAPGVLRPGARPPVPGPRAAARATTAPRSGSATPRCGASRRASPASTRSTPWTRQLVELAGELVAARREAIAVLATGVRRPRRRARPRRRTPRVRRRRRPRRSSSRRGSQRDLERGDHRCSGPHLDDVAVRSGARDLRTFGSQGEQRTAVLALLLAEAEVADRTAAATSAAAARRRALGARRDTAPRARRADRPCRPDDRHRDRRRRICRSSRPSCCASRRATSGGAPDGADRRRRAPFAGRARAARGVLAAGDRGSLAGGRGGGDRGGVWPQRVARDGTLHVATTSSTWAFELGRLAPDDRSSACATRLGDDAPPALRFAPGRVPSSRRRDLAGGGAARRCTVSPETRRGAGELTAAIEDEELRGAGRQSGRRKPLEAARPTAGSDTLSLARKTPHLQGFLLER